MNKMFYMGMLALISLAATDLHALPRNTENISSAPKKHFEIKMVVNQIDMGESFDLELSYSPEECANYRNIIGEMSVAKVKKLDEDFFQEIGLSSLVFEPFLKIYEKTRLYSFDKLIGLLKKKNVDVPLETLAPERQELIKTLIANDTETEKLNELNGQERTIYQYFRGIFNQYINSGNKVLSQEFHYNKLERFLRKEIQHSCENKSFISVSKSDS